LIIKIILRFKEGKRDYTPGIRVHVSNAKHSSLPRRLRCTAPYDVQDGRLLFKLMTIKAFHKTKFESKSFRLCSRVSEAVRVYASERVECKAFESPMETKVQSTLRSARWAIFIQTLGQKLIYRWIMTGCFCEEFKKI
jgi:hypothetical protein